MSLRDDIQTARSVLGPIDTAFRFYKGASLIHEMYEPQIDDARSKYRRARRLYDEIRD